jgi:site-specific DNA recombinase
MTQTSIKKAVIYCRVSSQKQLREGDGLESQRVRCEEFARYRDLEVIEIFRDEASGGAVNRPGMKAMIAFLKSKREPHIVIIDDISRLARGLDAHLTLRDTIRKAGGVLQSPSIDFADDDSDSSLMENVLASVSQHARQKNKEQTRNRMRGRMMNGYWSFRAPIGYKFQKVSGHGNMLVRDEPLASVIQEIFEGYEAGRFEGPAEIMRYLEAHPAWPRSRRETLTVERVLEILERVHYAGYLNYPEWGIHMREGKHEPIISLATFSAVQDRLKGNAKAPARKDIALDFVLRGAVLCHDCSQPYRACWTKGRYDRYPYYLCQTKGCASYGKSIKRDVMEREFEELLASLRPSHDMYRLAVALFRELWDARVAASHGNRAQLQAEVKLLEQQIEQLVDRIVNTESPAVLNAYETRLASLETQKAKAAEMVANCGRPITDFDSAHRTALEFLENPIKTWACGTLEAKRGVIRMAFASRLSYQRGHGFRTAETAIPFRIFNDLEGLESEDSEMVPRRGLEPPRPCERQHLKLVRLPIPPSGHGCFRSSLSEAG